MTAHTFLIDRIRSRKASLTILGLGHVGLPTALIFARAGFKVTGVDLDLDKVEALRQGKCYMKEPGLREILGTCLQNGTFSVANDSSDSIRESDFVSICVPTPVVNRAPDLAYFGAAIHAVKAGVHERMMVLVESTVPPRTLSNVIVPELEALGFRIDEDLFLAYCPERLVPGEALKEFAMDTRIVGGVGPRSGEIGAELYKTVCRNVVVTDSLTAELAKLSENTFRDLNIAYANLLALICERYGADVSETIKLANTHPRVRIHTPGVGVGGPCLPKDPFILVYGLPDDIGELVKVGRKLNDGMVRHAIDVVARTLRENGVDIGHARIAILGLSYKPETDDVTNSPAIPIIKGLLRMGASVVAYDPYTTDTCGAENASNSEEAIQGSDCIIIVTAHLIFKSLDLSKIRRLAKKNCVIFDGPRILDPNRVKSAGLTYLGTGYGVAGRIHGALNCT